MATRNQAREAMKKHGDIIAWLLDSDPAIRWQVLRDLTEASPETVRAEREKIVTEGWGAQLLSLQAADGRWGNAAWNRGWNSTMHVLMLLMHLGIDPECREAQQAINLIRERVTWAGCGPPECDNNPFFFGELEPCINGQVATVGAYFGQDIQGIVERLLAEQLADGGWNCEAPNSSKRSSFNTTICVLEALLEFENSEKGSSEVRAARQRGEAYLLDRQLFKRKSTGQAIGRDRKGGTDWTQLAFPCWWHYDVLRALEYLLRAGVHPDERMTEAIEIIKAKQTKVGWWLLENKYPGMMLVEMGEEQGFPSRWVTLRAMRVLAWHERTAELK